MLTTQASRTLLNSLRMAPASRAFPAMRFYSARPDLASGQRGDHAHGPAPGAHPSPEINVARTRSTLRVLVPSVSAMLLFIGWWFLGHPDRDSRKDTLNLDEGENKLKGSKHRAAQQLASGERGADGSLQK